MCSALPKSHICGCCCAHCAKRTSCVSMRRVRSVSGHVSPVRCLKPAPLGSRGITRVHRYYGRLRLPTNLLPSSLFRLVGECACAQAVGSPGLLPILVVRLGAAFDPGWAWPACLGTGHTVACWRLETIGPFQRGHYGTQHLHGRRYPLPLLLACFRAYASSAPLPAHLQGSIPGPWLAVTGAGFPPVRIGSIAQPQPRPGPKRFSEISNLSVVTHNGSKLNF